MSDTAAIATDRCPRCGGAFHCGVSGREPCACSSVTLDATLQAALRGRYRGCLCLRCLQALARGAALDAAPAVDGR
ncbi:MAG TPA: cysteine-rich CWC family protein [Rubrivivax sp.]|nr:cysteine-rich CWC family protein [Rubrivivax sp.]